MRVLEKRWPSAQANRSKENVVEIIAEGCKGKNNLVGEVIQRDVNSARYVDRYPSNA